MKRGVNVINFVSKQLTAKFVNLNLTIFVKIGCERSPIPLFM